ncbi:MAG: phage terminase large subunit [Pyrinomonadaceae bacterium]
MQDHEANLEQKVEACFELYKKYGGRDHDLIEREMRKRGHRKFSRRILYKRRARGRERDGWIDRYGWRSRLRARGISAAETLRRRAAKENWPQINADNTDRTGHNLSDPDPRHQRPSAAKSLRQRLGVSAVQMPAKPFGDLDAFQAWLKQVSPGMTWDWRHQLYIYERLKRVTDGTCKRLMIFLPPRHGKSEMVTVRYAAWRIRQDPSMNIILGSYNQKLANRFSRKIRRVLCDDSSLTAETQRRGGDETDGGMTEMHDAATKCDGCKGHSKSSSQRLSVSAVKTNSDGPMFPFIKQRPANSVAEWETAAGGGLRAVGVGGGVTGFGADLIVVDDPVKSRAEAESIKYRARVWDWFNDDIYTRLEPNGAIILIQTRWHEDDLAGRLIREMDDGGERWEIISLPALAESGITNDQLRITNSEENSEVLDPDIRNSSFVIRNLHTDEVGRAPGEALCPQRYDEAALDRLKRKLGSYSFASLYQQHPVPADGGIFKRHWFKNIVPHAPPGLKWCRGYDLAVSTRTTADYTASFRVAYDTEGNLYIADGFRRRIEFPEQRRYIIDRIRTERDTIHGVEMALHGQAMMQDLRRQAKLQGRAFRGVPVKDDKVTRALLWQPLAEDGKVRLVKGPWIDEFLDEVCSFPAGAADDQIDAVSLAVQMFEQQASRLHVF